MANFAEIADIEAFLQIEIDTSAKVTAAERALVAATAAIKNYCKQDFEQVADDVEVFDVEPGTRRLFLSQLPVTAVATVVEDGETLVVDDDYKLGSHGILHRIGQDWEDGIQIVTVTYTHGYSTIPDDVVDVCTRAAARAYQAGLRAAEQDGTPGVSSKQLGDFSVSFEGTGGAEGVMGASAARILLMSEKDTLDNYRPGT